MYALSQIRRGLSDPVKSLHVLHTRFQRGVRGQTGQNVMERDWDNLIILDGCRYDDFRRRNTIPGDLDSILSVASNTQRFMEQTFGTRDHLDTVFVAGNTNVRHAKSEFCDRIRLWEAPYVSELWPDQYDDPRTIVMPETVVDTTLDARDRYPNKRLIVHFLQPHFPSLGETGRAIFELDDLWWKQIKRGDITREAARQAYLENVDIAIEHARRLVPELDGKTVITADHGEMFGRWGVYEHPPEMFVPGLVKVPWFTCQFAERKRIEAGIEGVGPAEETPEVRDRLADLGYLPEHDGRPG